MHSLASAAQLLAKCSTVEQLPALLTELGFSQTLAPLTSDAEASLALPPELTDVRISTNKGALRALAWSIPEGDIRTSLQQVASRLNARASQLLWLLVSVDPHRRELALAAFDSGAARPRTAALVTRIDEIVDSDAETLCALAAARANSDILIHSRWLEILGRESVSRRFFRELERVVGSLAASLTPVVSMSDSAELALLYVSRLLFLSFLETKGWLDRDHGFLGNRFADCMVAGGGYHGRVLKPLFFGTLNTHPSKRSKRAREFGRIPFLNGGLFSRSPLEKRTRGSLFPDEALGDVFADLLSRYRFTAREDATAWSEAAIDPEMLGKAFESLMSSRDRKKSGAFYTPQSLVREVTRSALTYGLESQAVSAMQVASALDGDIPSAAARSRLLESLSELRVLDPACGSGAFLVHVLEEVAGLHLRLGDPRAPHEIRRALLTRSIYGVDLNPTAVWLCELRLWLSMVIEDPETDPRRVTPLPNLDRNVRVGDSLAGEGFKSVIPLRAGGRVAKLRARYSRSTGPRKRSLAKALDSAERECAMSVIEQRISGIQHQRRELISMLRSPDLFGAKHHADAKTAAELQSLRREIFSARAELRRMKQGGALPFSFSAGFADAASRGGFDVIAGNPPWVRTHNLDDRTRRLLRDRFTVYRDSAWIGGSQAAAAGRGFASQVDAAALFVERCTELLRPGGAMSLILPAKLWRSLAGGGVRSLLLERTSLREIHDLTDAPQLFAAAVYPSVVVASRSAMDASNHAPGSCVEFTHQGRSENQRWRMASHDMAFDASRGSPWLIVPPEVRRAFDNVVRNGTPLSQSVIGRPQLGVKTGCNEAFLVTSESEIELDLLRPVVRGDQVTRWAIEPGEDRIIWTHNTIGPLDELPQRAALHLARWRRTLELRADARGKRKWWMLFRTESADSSNARVVWCDIGRQPRAAVLRAGDRSVPLNTCYVVRCRDQTDAFALTALLNSTLAAAWLAVLAEPARGGYRRYMGWTMAVFTIPSNWVAARSLLAPLAMRAAEGEPPTDSELLSTVLEAYQLRIEDVAPILEWSL